MAMISRTSKFSRLRATVAMATVIATGIGFSASAQAATSASATTAAVDLLTPPTIGGVNGTGFVVGYRFEANTDLLVTALGAYDYGLDGIQGGASVGLYTLGGDLLASASIPSGTADSFLDGYFRYVDIAGVRLSAGTQYVLGAYSEDPNGFFNQNYGGVSLSVDPAITLLRNRDKAIVSQLVFPDREPNNTHLGSFGPNMQITPVPEPASMAMMLAGLGAVALCVRRRDRTRRKASSAGGQQ